MPDDLVITGLGLVTPLGVGVEATWRSMLAGAFVTGEGRVPAGRDMGRSRVAQLGLLAAREAIAGSGTRLDEAALVVGTSKGPVDEWLADPATIAQSAVARASGTRECTSDELSTAHDFDANDPRAAVALATPPRPSTREPEVLAALDATFGLATLADELARGLPLSRINTRLTLTAACASGLHALTRAALLLQAGDARTAIVVATESSLDPLWHGTFRRMGVLAAGPCRPLDEARDGFVISEAAAALVIERRPARTGEVVLDACAIAADATHLTGIDPNGRTVRSLIGSLMSRLHDGDDVDLVHAHATATANDSVELAAIRTTLGDRPAVYSHKGSLGHTLGASSLLAVVLNARMHATNEVPPMPTTTRPIARLPARGDRPIRRSVCLAAGFAGALAAAALRTAD